MNLYFRILLILIKSKFAARIGLLDESRLSFRVWPLDCDINLHLTNARYLALADVSRIYYLGQLGVLFPFIKRNWLPVAQAQEISYFKPVLPFQRFEIVTRFTHWDEKYWYTEHKFFAGEKYCAILQVRGVFVHGKEILSVPDLVEFVDKNAKVPDRPVSIQYWQKLIDAKKQIQD